jgi:type IV secretory pathway VirB10-like protein
MASRILNITACCFVAVWPTALHGQGPDAQSVTQSILDQHKSADPTNSSRSLTGRSQEFDISKIPPPPGPSPKTTRSSRKTLQRIRELEKEKKKFLTEQTQSTKFLTFSAERAEQNANQRWEKSEKGKTLRRLKAEVAEASKAGRTTEFDISNVPLPRSSPK